jgi:hypothetical protein
MGERLTAGDCGLDITSTGEGDLEFLGDPVVDLDGVERGDNSLME